MKIEFKSIADRGNYDKERLVLKVLADTDIGDHLVAQTDALSQDIGTELYHTFWPSYKTISSGDLIVLYTKSGKDSEKELSDGRHTHFYYWGLNSAIWDNNDKAAVILHAPEMITKRSDEL